MTWLITVASLLGVWLNIKKHVACFWIWAATNCAWTIVDLAHDLYSQAALQAIYFILSVVGIVKWSRREAKE